MQVNLTLAVVVAALVGCGVYLLLERSITRVLVGLVLLSNGVNVMFMIASGRPGTSPIVGSSDPEDMSDPLPQALVLTAIVITLGTIAFLLAMAHRSWQLNGHDDVQDDVEDAAIRKLAIDDLTSDSYGLTTGHQDDDEPGEEAAVVKEEGAP
ncbi:Na(+)/H(+) antiporter subunit C [Nocardioides zeae]|uniref:Na(+)/H(+) antiporter subunit C n=1 Tax=Nocardioides imazamoxiresistens TaxID=3231893 RepID=A0ABU3PVV7_9ACTN|nr:Na(+)/H(+) antiporter subunit C [Nocardioides zeae]MDT9593341.1 Na(+)/H(+) antiporter subunit C [Nocardioides zeae]